MNAPTPTRPLLLPELDATQLDWLEEEAIFILRETVGRVRAAGAAVLRRQGFVRRAAPRREGVQARTARRNVGRLPFPLLHVDTGHNFPEVIEFRDRRVAEIGEQLVVGHLEDSIARGTVRLASTRTNRATATRPWRCWKRSRSTASTC